MRLQILHWLSSEYIEVINNVVLHQIVWMSFVDRTPKFEYSMQCKYLVRLFLYTIHGIHESHFENGAPMGIYKDNLEFLIHFLGTKQSNNTPWLWFPSAFLVCVLMKQPCKPFLYIYTCVLIIGLLHAHKQSVKHCYN